MQACHITKTTVENSEARTMLLFFNLLYLKKNYQSCPIGPMENSMHSTVYLHGTLNAQYHVSPWIIQCTVVSSSTVYFLGTFSAEYCDLPFNIFQFMALFSANNIQKNIKSTIQNSLLKTTTTKQNKTKKEQKQRLQKHWLFNTCQNHNCSETSSRIWLSTQTLLER